MIAEFKLKTKRDIDGKLTLADFVDFGFELNLEKKIVVNNKK
jgi:hypothetical protein